MTIDKLRFTFENCESFTINGKYIGTFLIDDIHTSICRMGNNWIDEIITADLIVIEIHKNANTNYEPFELHDYCTNKFNRIFDYQDITNIDVDLIDQYADDETIATTKHYKYLVDWCADDEYVNFYQKAAISFLGHLYIVISKNKDIEDFFDPKDMNDEDMMRFHWDMLS